MDPRPRRLSTPGYGFEDVKDPGAKLPWSHVDDLLVKARTYWIASVRPDGRPHLAPVWGVWANELIFETSSESVKARNLGAEPRCSFHIDHVEAGVIVEGTAEATQDEAIVRAFAESYVVKYERGVDQYLERPVSIVFRLVPRVAYSFREYLGQTATRWEF
jgi:PPOX class probable F420-dependent enzyme